MFVSSNQLTDLLLYFKRKLSVIYDEREIESIFFLICLDQFGLSKIQVLNQDKRLSESELLTFRDYVNRLQKSEPIQYILGQTEFYGLKFKVTPAVLVPRPETEELVDLIIQENKSLRSLTILDIGTGSGCIPVSLKKFLQDTEVVAIDISEAALEIANHNAYDNDVVVNFKKIDILKEDISDLPELDIIVSNPPYIPELDKKEMHQNVLDHEPALALFVANDNPLIFYKRIIEIAANKLKKGGRLYFEIHRNYGSEISSLLVSAGYRMIEIKKDISGSDRFIKATK